MRSQGTTGRRVARALGVALALAIASLASSSQADREGAPVVATVGDVKIRVDALERRLAGTPAFQMKTLGSTAAEIRRAALERPLVRDELLAQGARREKLDARSDVAERLRANLRSAIVAELREDVLREGVGDDAIKAYYDANKARFVSPAKTALWRILCAKREEAVAVLEEVKKDPSPKRWGELARERSTDKTSRERGGNLGFVTADGASNEPGIKPVDRAILTAADQVKDGELVPDPVPEGDGFAVVWRRQSVRAVDRGLELEAPAIRQLLVSERVDAKLKELLEKLRKEHLVSKVPDAIDVLEIAPGGDVTPARRPGTLPATRRPAAAPPKPTQSDHGNR